MQVHTDCQPLYEFIKPFLAIKGIRLTQLCNHIGFKNSNKAQRRLRQVFADADFASTTSQQVLRALPQALDINIDELRQVLEQCLEKQRKRIKHETAVKNCIDRLNFKPYAMLKGSQSIPSQITIFALSGGVNRWLRVPLDENAPPETYLPIMLGYIKANPNVTFFGKVTGFVIHYHYNEATHYDLDGNIIKIEQQAYMPGQSAVSISGRTYTEQLLGRIL